MTTCLCQRDLTAAHYGDPGRQHLSSCPAAALQPKAPDLFARDLYRGEDLRRLGFLSPGEAQELREQLAKAEATLAGLCERPHPQASGKAPPNAWRDVLGGVAAADLWRMYKTLWRPGQPSLGEAVSVLVDRLRCLEASREKGHQGLRLRAEEAERLAKLAGDRADAAERQAAADRETFERLHKAEARVKELEAKLAEWEVPLCGACECFHSGGFCCCAWRTAHERVEGLPVDFVTQTLRDPAALKTHVEEWRSDAAEPADNPELDGTDAAHPAWWRGQDYGADGVARKLQTAAEYGDNGRGTCGSPVVEQARRVILARVDEITALRLKVEFLEKQLAAESHRASCAEASLRLERDPMSAFEPEEPAKVERVPPETVRGVAGPEGVEAGKLVAFCKRCGFVVPSLTHTCPGPG